jgi:bifunctional DNA-binding transcriptional regulator/antitoxin component of YhaV-PrlF toxin-antitoxin module
MVKERRPAGATRVSRKNQVTLPVAALAGSGLGPGDLVEVVVVGVGVLELRRWRSRLGEVVGTLPGFERDVDLEASRDSWDSWDR